MVSYDAGGKEVIYGFFREGNVFWGSFFERERRYRFSAICLSDTVVYEYPRSAVEKMMICNQNIFLEIIESLSGQLKDTDEKIAVLSAPTPEERLAGFFLYSFRRSKDGTVVRRLDDISGAINLRQETVSRYIQRFVREGYIKKTSQSRFVIKDAEGLRKIFLR